MGRPTTEAWVHWGGIAKAAKAAGCTRQTLAKRCRAGATPAEAVAMGGRKKGRARKGSKWAPWGGLEAAAKLAGVSTNALRSRVVAGMTPAEAVAAGADQRMKRGIFAAYGGALALSQLTGLSRWALRARVRRGMTLEQAATTPRWNATALRARPLAPGERFGQLVVVEFLGSHALCRCDCGALTKPRSTDLRRGIHRSCGCARNARRRAA